MRAEVFGQYGNLELERKRKMWEILEEIYLRCGNQTKCVRNDLIDDNYGNHSETNVRMIFSDFSGLKIDARVFFYNFFQV